MTTPLRHGVVAVYIVLTIITAMAMFYNLGGRPLWGDEAETAVLAANVMKYGLPVSTDGKNTITLYGKAVDSNDNNVWTWRPWLDEYLTAASFSMLGKSTVAARLPFAFLGLLSAILLARLVYKIYETHETTIIAVLCLITSELFILHARQCRYYSVVIFAEIWLILGLYRIIRGRGRSGAFHMSMALATAFYCNYIIVIGNIIAIVFTVILVQERRQRIWRYVISGFAAFALMAAPWILYARPWSQAGQLNNRLYIPKLHYYAVEINFHMFPFALLLIPAAYFIFRRFSGGGQNISIEKTPIQPAQKDVELFLWIVIPLQLAIISIMPGLFVRYFVPLIPVFCILQAALLVRYVKVGLLRYALVGLLCLTNILSILGLYFFRYGHKPAFPIINLMRSIATPYEGRLDDVAAFLKKEATPNDSILVFDSEFPLIFYTDMRIIDGRFISGRDMPPPDWFFPIGPSCVFDMKPDNIPDYLSKDFTPIEIEVHKSKRAGSIPDPDKYEYFTAKEKEKFVIYRRNSGTK
ncbi:glycosyltransferase family 39 protein [Candidatus Magnetominusculus dajiuhuensis]|uniref:glycosyltransferase family 39 protein n=1 Tax=Candidatus Magnetominusculus dajiuhuensis TaxID=3137712 RepID=UPI003B4366B3